MHFNIRIVLLFSLSVIYFIVNNKVIAQSNSISEMKSDLNRFKQSQLQDKEQFKIDKEKALLKMKEQYQVYIREMNIMQKYYFMQKDTLGFNTISEIIDFEVAVTQSLNSSVIIKNEIRSKSLKTIETKPSKAYLNPNKSQVKKPEIKLIPEAEPNREVEKQSEEIINSKELHKPQIDTLIFLPNKQFTDKVIPILVPVPKQKSIITSKFGMRIHPTLGKSMPHNGVDFGAGFNSKIYAADMGEVIIAEYSNSFGNFVIIKHANNMSTVYGHLSQISVQQGDQVQKGDIIGYSGSTGRSTGPHLHYEVRNDGIPVNPADYLLEYKF